MLFGAKIRYIEVSAHFDFEKNFGISRIFLKSCENCPQTFTNIPQSCIQKVQRKVNRRKYYKKRPKNRYTISQERNRNASIWVLESNCSHLEYDGSPLMMALDPNQLFVWAKYKLPKYASLSQQSVYIGSREYSLQLVKPSHYRLPWCISFCFFHWNFDSNRLIQPFVCQNYSIKQSAPLEIYLLSEYKMDDIDNLVFVYTCILFSLYLIVEPV